MAKCACTAFCRKWGKKQVMTPNILTVRQKTWPGHWTGGIARGVWISQSQKDPLLELFQVEETKWNHNGSCVENKLFSSVQNGHPLMPAPYTVLIHCFSPIYHLRQPFYQTSRSLLLRRISENHINNMKRFTAVIPKMCIMASQGATACTQVPQLPLLMVPLGATILDCVISKMVVLK